MLKRLYIDNFKCFVNFDLSFDSINLFLGLDGSGKTTIFDVLWNLQAFITADQKIQTLFKPTDLTRWQTSPVQTFELDIEGNGGVYQYELAIEHDDARRMARVHYERLSFGQKPVLHVESSGETQLYLDDDSAGPKFPIDGSRSAVASIPPRHNNTRLTWFKERLERLIIVQVMLQMMADVSQVEENNLTKQMANFVSWYRHISENQGKAIEITTILQEILDGFDHFRFEKVGQQQRLLKLSFTNANNHSVKYTFSELSDGQRALVALYTLIYATRNEDYTLCIDEPENFLALPEIQPWLTQLYDFCSDNELQALLISHHPELIDYLALSAGCWFDREGNTPVRTKQITDDGNTGLPISELVARGWLHE